jgi:hypothetical protein
VAVYGVIPIPGSKPVRFDYYSDFSKVTKLLLIAIQNKDSAMINAIHAVCDRPFWDSDVRWYLQKLIFTLEACSTKSVTAS